MNPHLEKIVTDPLALAGYALFLVFGIVTLVIKGKNKQNQWIVPAGFILAVICAMGGLAIGWHRDVTKTVNTSLPAPLPQPVMKIDKIEQKVDSGNATAGVQGSVTNNQAPPEKPSKPKQ